MLEVIAVSALFSSPTHIILLPLFLARIFMAGTGEEKVFFIALLGAGLLHSVVVLLNLPWEEPSTFGDCVLGIGVFFLARVVGFSSLGIEISGFLYSEAGWVLALWSVFVCVGAAFFLMRVIPLHRSRAVMAMFVLFIALAASALFASRPRLVDQVIAGGGPLAMPDRYAFVGNTFLLILFGMVTESAWNQGNSMVVDSYAVTLLSS